jgi:tetratricopeptide (TPR) repeat protein
LPEGAYAFAYYVKSRVLFYKKQFPEAIEAAQTAVALDPNAAYAYFAMAMAIKSSAASSVIEAVTAVPPPMSVLMWVVVAPFFTSTILPLSLLRAPVSLKYLFP